MANEINRTCSICGSYVSGMVYTLRYSDIKGKNRVEVSGCKDCIDRVEKQYNQFKNKDNLTVKQIIKKLGLNENQLYK